VSRGPRDEAGIQTQDRRLRVFVSSTLGELAEERRAVARAITPLRLTPAWFEAGAQLDELRSGDILDMNQVGRLLVELAADEEYFGSADRGAAA
jgi:hypothetical protein